MNVLDKFDSLPPLAKIVLGVAGLAGVIALTDRGGQRSSPSTPSRPSASVPPGERVRPGDRFEADLTGFLGNQTRPDLNAPGQIFEAIFVTPTNLPSPMGQNITSRHAGSAAQIRVPSAFVTRILP